VLDGTVWIATLTLTLLLVLAGAVTAAPGQAAQPDEAPSELGEELYPPTGYTLDPAAGLYPIANYDIGCSNAGLVGDTGCMTLGAGTNLFFTLAKALVTIAVWLLEAATGFTVEDTLEDAATAVADILDTRILGPTRISHLGLVVSALYMGWQFLRGRYGAGAGEFTLTLAVYAALLTVTATGGFGAAVTGAMGTAGGLSAEVVSLAADMRTGDTVSGRVGGALMTGFVRDPYDTINWGQLLTGTGCAAPRNEALASGPHGTADEPRTLMEAAGCEAQAQFNAEATMNRLTGSLLYLVVSLCALAVFLITAFTLVVAKGMALFLIALLPVALYAGLFPGAGRSLLWHWVSALIRILALVVALGVFLALLVAGLSGLLALPGGLWQRFLMVVFFMAVMWVGRRQLVEMSARFADSTLQRLDTARLGGGHGATWIRPYQAGGLTGLGLARTRQETAAEIPHTPERVKAAGSWAWRHLHPTNR
jgi:hypothetical protein